MSTLPRSAAPRTAEPPRVLPAAVDAWEVLRPHPAVAHPTVAVTEAEALITNSATRNEKGGAPRPPFVLTGYAVTGTEVAFTFL